MSALSFSPFDESSMISLTTSFVSTVSPRLSLYLGSVELEILEPRHDVVQRLLLRLREVRPLLLGLPLRRAARLRRRRPYRRVGRRALQPGLRRRRGRRARRDELGRDPLAEDDLL